MKYMLDTNICIYIIKQKPIWVQEKFITFEIDEVGVSSVASSELFYGTEKSQYKDKNREALDQFLLPLEVVQYDYKASVFYGKIRANMEKCGKVIGPLDMMIAAHALSLGTTLVTNNIKEFQRIDGLILENWVKHVL